MNKIAVNNSKKDIDTLNKVVSLFKFIEEINKLKQKIILNIKDHEWHRFIEDIPDDPENIHVFYRDRIGDVEEENETSVLLSVHKPEFERCPQPNSSFKKWLNDGWGEYWKDVSVKESLFIKSEDSFPLGKDLKNINETKENEHFEENSKRVQQYQSWKKLRDAWAERQNFIAKTRKFFMDLHKMSVALEREAETLELIVADGFIQDKVNAEIKHPIVTRRVSIRHDADTNTIYIEDTNSDSELYTELFQRIEDINLKMIDHASYELQEKDYHPLDRNDLPDFLKAFIHRLSPSSYYVKNGEEYNPYTEDRFILYHNPCYILRKRMDGVLKAIEQIISNIEITGKVPGPICDVVNGGEVDIPEDTREISLEEQLAEVGGESIDILLSKEANKEQLEIARRIERYNAVLVQGPPGTGKTHTIANLMGHFLSQGKTVLVTSHTQKALSVLKEKISGPLKNLCVSVIDDSNEDMEKSIDGITHYMSQHTSFELKKEMEELEQVRKSVVEDLADTRRKLFTIINKEYNSIIYNGDAISPLAAAAFVQNNSETLSYIPGKVRLWEPLPLSFSELTDLYKSNGDLTVEEEYEFENDIPDPQDIMLPADFERLVEKLHTAEHQLLSMEDNGNWSVINSYIERKFTVNTYLGQFELNYPIVNKVKELQEYVEEFDTVSPWMRQCAIDGKNGGTHRQLWMILIEQIENTCKCAENLIVKRFGKFIEIIDSTDYYKQAVEKLRERYTQKEKLGWLDLLLNKHLKVALSGATINGVPPQNVEDCDLILSMMKLDEERAKCEIYWNDLMGKYEVPAFCELDKEAPERIAANYIPLIQRYLDWYKNEYQVLKNKMEAVGLSCNDIFQYNVLDSEIKETEKILSAISYILPKFCKIFDLVNTIADIVGMLEQNETLLCSGARIDSVICEEILSAAKMRDVNSYQEKYQTLEKIYAKCSLKKKREDYLNRLEPVAPLWADAIRNRKDIHGSTIIPSNIDDAWKWKQYYGIIEEFMEVPYSELQKKSLSLSQYYREVTAKFAEKSAWYNLLKKTESDISMRQALNGWKLTVKKIGKGTGKNAPKYRAEARKLMVKCQEAVPSWIMPIGKALETLNPRQNIFDVVIIDEASQSDISSLAILYMGKKLIIVGDDKQVSPMAIGVEMESINRLRETYIDGKIPNAHLYDLKTSIYDIAATTFQPLMLREHFRCMPEIIGFSNGLSYDYKIKPLRDPSNSILLPSVVNYRVADGERIGKTNPNEAKTIVALMQACMEQPEYAGKTFGVISLLGDDQVKTLQEEIDRRIDTKEYIRRRILCGNASNFQGDERDVIFLSLVDCANGHGPVAKQAFGVDDAYRKRYNVAVSRAKDQLWVVDSLDPANDLKTGDIRKKLIEYSLNPKAIDILSREIDKKAESPFESAVAKDLAGRGYHLVQQWQVGAYRIDMVAVYGGKKVAIECDGDRYHSSETKIREDMERQTILERLGWQFIRIRGSEYYRSPDKTMDRVVSEMNEVGILPEDKQNPESAPARNTELLQRVKRRAYEIMKEPTTVTYSNKVLKHTEDAYPQMVQEHYKSLYQKNILEHSESIATKKAQEQSKNKILQKMQGHAPIPHPIVIEWTPKRKARKESNQTQVIVAEKKETYNLYKSPKNE